MRALLLAFLLIEVIGHAVAQSSERHIFSVRRYSTTEGLPHRAVHAIAQDKRGFIWVATQLGVARFDGAAFVGYGRAEGLVMDAVHDLLCDADGLLWLAHPDGRVSILDPETGRGRSFQEHVAGRAYDHAEAPIRGLVADNHGTIAFYQNDRLVRYRNAERGFEILPLTCTGTLAPWRIEPDGDILCHCASGEANRGELLLVPSRAWAQNDASLVKRITDVRRMPNVGLDLYDAKSTEQAGSYLFSNEGQAWLSRNDELKQFRDSDNPDVVQAWGAGSSWLPLSADRWLVDRTIRSMRPGDNAYTAPVLFDISTVFPETRHGLTDPLRDRLGNIWIGGDFGLFKLTMRPDRVQRWLYDRDLASGVGVNVRGMVVVNGDLHVNTQETGRWALNAKDGRVLRAWDKRENGLAIAADGQGGLWRANGWWLMHSGTDGTDDRTAQMLGADGGWSLLVLAPDRVLIGTDRGLWLEANGDLRQLKHPQHARLDESMVLHLQRDDDERILACTSSGIYVLNDAGEALEHWGPDAPPVNGVPHHLPADDIRHLFKDKSGIHWLATAAGGLVRWDRRTGATRMYGVGEGIPATSIHAVYGDANGWLWMPTDNGLVRFHPESGQVKILTTADGITNNEFNRIAHAQGPDGRLYFGGFNGITVIDPAPWSGDAEAVSAPLELTGVQLQERDSTRLTELTAAVRAGAPIVLQPGDRFFTVGMALLNYDDPSRIRYAWRIDGLDADWNLQAEPHLRISSLPYGAHILRIKAQDGDARWSANEIVMPIEVVRPVYLRWWFFALCAVLVGAIVYAVFRYRIQQLRRVMHVRDRIAMDLHDEVGSSLSGIVLFSSAVKNQAGSLPEKSAAMLHRIADNSTRAMESMNDIVWSVNTKNDQLAHVIDRMQAFAQPLCEASDIELTFHIAEGLPARKLGMEERKSLYLIFKEAVNNAVKHAQCSRIEVSLRRGSDGSIELVVADNGTGLRDGSPHEPSLGGNGLGNMRRRAGDVGGELLHRSGSPTGTEVVFSIPSGWG